MDLESIRTTMEEALVNYGPSFVGALATLVLGYFAAKIAAALFRRALRRAGVDITLVRFVGNIANAVLVVIVLIASLEQLGVSTTSFAAVLAAASLAVGLAFQDSLSNFAAGVLVIVFRPLRVGDFVEAAGVSGTVEEVQIFTTVLTTPDNKRVIVGNSKIVADNITNYSANKTRRVDLVFGISYADDIAKARSVLKEIIADDSRILSEPACRISVLALADSSVNFAVRPWVATPDYWDVYFDLTEQVKLRFDEASVSFPFPQRDVHLHSVPDAPSAGPEEGAAA